VDICGEDYSMRFQALSCKLLEGLAKIVVTGMSGRPQNRAGGGDKRKTRDRVCFRERFSISMLWLPGNPPPKLLSAEDFPLELWRTWFVVTGLYLLLHWFTFKNNPAPVVGLCTPIVPANFGSFRGLIAIPLALVLMQAGEIVGAQIRSRLVRVLYNGLFLFWLTAGINVWSFGQWSSLRTLWESS